MEKISLIIDTDPGIDDAVALAQAFFSPNLDIRLLCSTAGNLGIETTTQNTIHLAELFNQNIPVAQGLPYPLNRPLDIAHGVHGAMGFGNYVYDGVKSKAINLPAHEAMHMAVNLYPNTTIIVLGPLTNVAMFLQTYPQDKPLIKEIVFMGGTSADVLKEDNPYPEFNISRDPEACSIVLDSGVPVTIIPMDFGHTAFIEDTEIAKLKKINKTGEIFAAMYANYKDGHVPEEHAATHDSCAIAYVIEPTMFKLENSHAYIKYYNDRGVLVSDIIPTESKVKLAVDMNHKAFKNLYYGLLSVSKTADE